MPKNNSKYQELFISEAHDHLDALDAGLIDFEKDFQNQEVAKELMRHAHTLKGMAASMDYGDISNLAHSFEGMVENIKNGLSHGGVDFLFGALDELRILVEETRDRVERTKANPLVDKVGELEKADIKMDGEILDRPETFRRIEDVRIKTKKLDDLVELTAQLIVNKLRLREYFEATSKETVEGFEEYNKLIQELQYQVLELRLTPLIQVFNRFPRMVRDLAKKENKTIKLDISGGSIELDRTVLDQLGEPLVHLLRNSVDHGIDKEGTITLSAKRVGDSAVISIKDDGKGVDWEKIREKKKEVGSNLSDQDFLLTGGISTAEKVTEISGRGVGMGVVNKKIKEIGGRIEIYSGEHVPFGEEKNIKGTTFLLYIPVSLAIIKALLVYINGEKYAVPISNIDRLIDLNSLEIKKQLDQEVAVIDETGVPLIWLKKVFGGEKDAKDKERQKVMLTTVRDKKIGFVVDEVMSEQDIIVKPISIKLKMQKYFSAMTILGDGEPVPIIDTDAVPRKS